ncbi:hypothetical protein vBYenSP400_43 [Yersinia phage vB_YenS_P400]|nr:hypothetical protein vBYenSP400_43 [Yersinia phage vB_YenS_P400]
MSDMTLIPTGAMGGNEAGAAGLGGAVGAFIGSAFSNGGLGGFGRGGAVASEGVVVQNSLDTNAILGGISQLQMGQNSFGMSLTAGQGATNTTVERAASSNYTGLTAQNTQNLLASVQGFAGLNTAIQAGTNATVAAIGSADRGALERSFQAQLAAERCCCETNLNIERQGNATRDLMREQFANSQAVLICDLKSQVQTRDFLISQAAQTAQLRCEINQNAQLINFKLPTPPTPPSGCC